MLWIQTLGRRLEGVDESTVLRRPAPKERKCVSVGTGLCGSGDGGRLILGVWYMCLRDVATDRNANRIKVNPPSSNFVDPARVDGRPI